MTVERDAIERDGEVTRPWLALWAMVLGFFMILVDSTIVSVATPAIMRGLDADVNEVVWVTSAYLLAYAVPLLIMGRLGDRFGPRKLYLTGLVVFTVASLWCGLTNSVELLIVARVVQGLGAATMTPQTMAVITRIFSPSERGRAMSVWGATAGVAILVGPIAGGLLIDAAGWEWIFFVNVPVGIIGFVLAWRLVPSLSTNEHRFDWFGVALSAVAMFCIVFGIQEGQRYHWGQITGVISVWSLIGTGIVVLIGFVWWERVNRGEPLLPLGLFRDRNFSLSNLAITAVGFAVTAMGFPLMLYAQNVRGMGPTQAALLFVPIAVLAGGLAPVAGQLAGHVHPRYLAGPALIAFPIALFWLSLVMTPDSAVWELLLPLALIGLASAFLWGPIGTTATNNLPRHQAGAGSGVYNTTRQAGAVFGSAAIATLMQSRLAAELPGVPSSGAAPETSTGTLPAALHEGFSTAMAQSMLLPAFVLVVALVAVWLYARPSFVRGPAGGSAGAAARSQPASTTTSTGAGSHVADVPISVGPADAGSDGGAHVAD